MEDTIQVQISQRGLLTLPKTLRDVYHLKPGDILTLLDLGGVFVLSQRQSQVDFLAERIGQALVEKGETLESMLRLMREERENYGKNTDLD